MKRLLFVLFFALTAWGQEPTVTLNGSNYTLQPHPRVFLNAALNARVAYSGGLAPKAVAGNPAWVGVGTRAAAVYSSFGNPASTHDHDSSYTDGQAVALFAMYYYSDNSQTTFQAAALYLLNNMQQYVSLVCNTGVKDCVNGGNGYWNGSYGPAYYMQNWILAYELMRPSMTTLQQQTFADKWLNDISLWGGVDGSPGTSCTNPTLVGTTSVSISSSGVVTASAPYFGSGQTLQVGDWIYAANSDNGAVIASVTDSTHAVIESDQWSSMSGYSGALFTRRGGWAAGDCGWLWLTKHDWYTPYSIIQTTTGYPSTGGFGGQWAQIDPNQNLVLSSTFGIMASLVSLGDDDVNFSSRTSPELTALYDSWYTTTFQGLNEYNYTGFTPTGSVYGIWRAQTFFPLTAFEIVNSVVSPPPLTAGVWAKNMAHHSYMATFPSCPAEEQEYGQTFSPESSYNSFLPNSFGIAALITMYQGTPEGEYLNYWAQNLWQTCPNGGYSGNTPGTNLMFTNTSLGSGQFGGISQHWAYLYMDSAYPTNSSLPTGSVDNCSDAGCSGQVPTTTALPMAGMISRTGYSSITDTLVNFYALAIPEVDHTLPEDGAFNPADYRIFKGGFLLGDDSATYNNGGPSAMTISLNGDGNISTAIPFVALMPAGANDPSNRYTYALVDATKSYNSAAKATAVERYLVHFKKPGTQDFVVVYDYVAAAAGEQMQTYLHYPQKGSTSLSGATVTSSFSGTGHSDATQLLSQVLAPQGTNSVYTYTNNSNGSYSGGNGDTFRVSLCASSNGSSCSTTNTVGEFAVVHEPVAGSSNSLPATEMLSTIDASHRGIEIDGASPKVAVFPIGPSEPTFTTATFTTAHPGSAQYLVAGLAPGTYNVTLNGAAIVTGAAVSAGNNSLYFESTAGAIVVSQTGAATLTGITVSPATASLVAGAGTQSYTATCTYSNGTSSTCTTTVTWSSSSTATATITSAGVATGIAAGSATITAGSGGVSGTSVSDGHRRLLNQHHAFALDRIRRGGGHTATHGNLLLLQQHKFNLRLQRDLVKQQSGNRIGQWSGCRHGCSSRNNRHHRDFGWAVGDEHCDSDSTDHHKHCRLASNRFDRRWNRYPAIHGNLHFFERHHLELHFDRRLVKREPSRSDHHERRFGDRRCGRYLDDLRDFGKRTGKQRAHRHRPSHHQHRSVPRNSVHCIGNRYTAIHGNLHFFERHHLELHLDGNLVQQQPSHRHHRRQWPRDRSSNRLDYHHRNFWICQRNQFSDRVQPNPDQHCAVAIDSLHRRRFGNTTTHGHLLLRQQHQLQLLNDCHLVQQQHRGGNRQFSGPCHRPFGRHLHRHCCLRHFLRNQRDHGNRQRTQYNCHLSGNSIHRRIWNAAVFRHVHLCEWLDRCLPIHHDVDQQQRGDRHHLEQRSRHRSRRWCNNDHRRFRHSEGNKLSYRHQCPPEQHHRDTRYGFGRRWFVDEPIQSNLQLRKQHQLRLHFDCQLVQQQPIDSQNHKPWRGPWCCDRHRKDQCNFGRYYRIEHAHRDQPRTDRNLDWTGHCNDRCRHRD